MRIKLMKRTNRIVTTKKLLAMLAVLVAAGSLAQADLIVTPKDRKQAEDAKKSGTAVYERMVQGTLTWKTAKGPDGTEQKTALQLTTRPNQVIVLATGDAMKDTSKYENFIGKSVLVRFTTEPPVKDKPLKVKSITSIKEAPVRAKS